MATERTMMTPDGEILTFSVADETYLTPEGSIVNGDITAAAGGGNEPLFYHHQRMLSRCS